MVSTRKEETRAIFAKYTRINDPAMLDGSIQYGYDFMGKNSFRKAASVSGDVGSNRQVQSEGETGQAGTVLRQHSDAGGGGRGILRQVVEKKSPVICCSFVGNGKKDGRRVVPLG